MKFKSWRWSLLGLLCLIFVYVFSIDKPDVPSLPIGLDLRGALTVELDVLDVLDTLKSKEITSKFCKKDVSSDVLLIAPELMSVKDLVTSFVTNLFDEKSVEYLFLSVDPTHELDLAGRKFVGEQPYFVVSNSLRALFPAYANTVVDTNYLLRPGQLLFVSFSDDVEYCQSNKSMDLNINTKGLLLVYLQGDMRRFLELDSELESTKVLSLWRTNLTSYVETDSNDFLDLEGGFYWIETGFIKTENQVRDYLKSLILDDNNGVSNVIWDSRGRDQEFFEGDEVEELLDEADEVVEMDRDGAGLSDEVDECRQNSAVLNGCPDGDGDGVSELAHDGILADNCPDVFNVDQNDFDDDLLGDVCDPDVDGDGVIDYDSQRQKMRDLCLFTSPDVEAEQLTEFGCIDSDGDGAIDERDDNRILLSDVLELQQQDQFVVDNCSGDINQNQLDYDNDGLGDVCDDRNDLDFDQMIAKIIDPNKCGVGESVPESYVKNDSRPFTQYPIRHAINHSDKDLISQSPLYDEARSMDILNTSAERGLRKIDMFFPDFALYNDYIIEGLEAHVEAVWSAPNVLQWLQQMGPDIDWLRIGTGNVSSVFYSDRQDNPQWIDSLNFDYLNTSKSFKLAYTDMDPREWAIEVESSAEVLPLKQEVTDFLPEFDGKLPVFYTNDVIFRTEISREGDLDNVQRSNLEKLLAAPLIELRILPDDSPDKAFMFSTNCHQRPRTSETTYFQRYAQNSADFDDTEMEFDSFSSSKFGHPDLQRMRFKSFDFIETPLFGLQTHLRTGLDELLFNYFEDRAGIVLNTVSTSNVYIKFPTRAFVRGCGARNLNSTIEGAYDPRIFVPEGQDGWNLLIADNDLNEFEWASDDRGTPLEGLPEGIGVCPDEFADCDFVEQHACEQEGLEPYVLMFKDLIDIQTINKNVNVHGLTCLVPNPGKPGARLAVADALSTLASDYELDALSSDDYTAPSKAELGDNSVNPTFGLNPTWRSWFANVLDDLTANELFYILGIANSNAKSSLYEMPAIQEATRLESWANLAIDVRQELMCAQDQAGETFMSHKFWNPNVSSLGHSVVVDLFEFSEMIPSNSAKLAMNASMVADKFLKIFATGYWDEKWSRGAVTSINRSDGYFSWLKLLSANYASKNGYMVIANNFFMFWNELLSFDRILPGETLRFEPSSYSLENSLAEYLLVQNDDAPILASPYRYHQSAVNVPDNIQNVFNYFKQVVDVDSMSLDSEQGEERVAPMNTWMSRIMNYEYGSALGDAYVMRLEDVDIASPNAYVLAREYEHAVVIKNFSTRDLKVDFDSLALDQTWVRLVGVPLVRTHNQISTSRPAESASSQLFCAVGEKQDLAFMSSCRDAIVNESMPNPTSNPACFVACNSQKEYMAQRNKVALGQREAYLEMDTHEYIEPIWVMEVSQDTIVRAGHSVILFDYDRFAAVSDVGLDQANSDRYDPFKSAAFCRGIPLEPIAAGMSYDEFVLDYDNNMKRLVCNDLFKFDFEQVVDFGLKSVDVVLNDNCAAVDYLDLKCILENVMGLDNEYFKQMELERLQEASNE